MYYVYGNKIIVIVCIVIFYFWVEIVDEMSKVTAQTILVRYSTDR